MGRLKSSCDFYQLPITIKIERAVDEQGKILR